MVSYAIGQLKATPDGDAFNRVIEAAYEKKVRPLCLCRPAGVEMYIARLDDRHIIKRMPGTALHHDITCQHYEPPENLSGLGDVMGKSVKELEDGTTLLTLDFSLSKTGQKKAPAPSEVQPDQIKQETTKLTLLSLLHLLWYEAALHRSAVDRKEKRTWRFVRSALLAAAALKSTKQASISDRLFIPEPYNKDYFDEIDARRRTFMRRFRPAHPTKRDMMLVVGELKEIESARFGYKIVLKHAPTFPIFLQEDTYKKLEKRWLAELEIKRSLENVHAVIIATVSLNHADQANVEEFSLMLTDANWIPFETLNELDLLDELDMRKRSFVKGLRFNVKNRPLASFLLTDVRPQVAIYVIPPNVEQDYLDQINSLSDETNIPNLLWYPDQESLPNLPDQCAPC